MTNQLSSAPPSSSTRDATCCAADVGSYSNTGTNFVCIPSSKADQVGGCQESDDLRQNEATWSSRVCRKLTPAPLLHLVSSFGNRSLFPLRLAPLARSSSDSPGRKPRKESSIFPCLCCSLLPLCQKLARLCNCKIAC